MKVKNYFLTLFLVLSLGFITKGNKNEKLKYYHTTFKTLKDKWVKDTIVFEFNLKDSLLSIKTETEDRNFNILSVSFNDYKVEDNTIADIYKLSDGYYLWIEKNPDNLDILQLILFDKNDKHFIYR